MDSIGIVLIAWPLVNALNNGVVGLWSSGKQVVPEAIIYSQTQARNISSGGYGW
ncbi:MAG: hypothetical protein QMC38_02030 [Sinobacterium sp.]